VSGADYYPFGLTMSDREILTEPYRFGYQGQYSEENETTGWNEFDLRMYDKRFGRWLSPDPYGQFYSPYVAMGNNPVLGIDYDGARVFYRTLIEANRTALNINSILKDKFGLENAISVHERLIPGTKDKGFYIEFNKDVDINKLTLSAEDEFIVKSIKNTLEANTDILGEIVDPATRVNRGSGTVGSNKGFTFSTKNFKIPNDLPDYDPNWGSLKKPSIGSQTLHEVVWHVSPAGETFVDYGYESNWFNTRVGGTFSRLGSHKPLSVLVNRAIVAMVPRFNPLIGSPKIIRTPRFRH